MRTNLSVLSSRFGRRATLAVGAAASSLLLLGAAAQWGPEAIASSPASNPTPTATSTAAPTPDSSPTAASSPTPSASAAPAVVTLTGSVPALPASSATVYAQVEVPIDVNSKGVPHQIDADTVASETITSPEFSIPIPDSATLDQAEQSGKGIVNFEIIVSSGANVTSWGQSVPVTASAAVMAGPQVSMGAGNVFRFSALPAFRASGIAQPAVSPDRDPPGECVWTPYGSEVDDLTRIGEVHVANTPGVSDQFVYVNSNDQTISIGYSGSPTADWSIAGTVTLTNSIGTKGSYTFGQGEVIYVDTTGIYQEYEGTSSGGADECDGLPTAWEAEEFGTDGNAQPGTNKPQGNPYSGGCINDPYNIELIHNEGYDSDHGTATTYDTVSTVFGYSFEGSDGFTTDVEHDYSAGENAATTYICGPKNYQVDNSPILYNTTSLSGT